MGQIIDETDRRILRALQMDAAQSLDEVSQTVSLSRNACWRRIRALEAAGIITGRVALLDPGKLNLGLLVLVQIRTAQHNADWLAQFRRAVLAMDEITSAYRVSGELDYVLHVRVRDVPAYDAFYQRFIARVPVTDVSASFVMEDIKDTTRLPL